MLSWVSSAGRPEQCQNSILLLPFVDVTQVKTLIRMVEGAILGVGRTATLEVTKKVIFYLKK